MVPREGAQPGGRQRTHSTAYTRAGLAQTLPPPVTPEWGSSLYPCHIPLRVKRSLNEKRNKSHLPPQSAHPPHQHKWKETGSTARLGFRKENPGTEKDAGLVPSFPVGLPAARVAATLRPVHPRRGASRSTRGSDRREEVIGGKEYGLGIEVQRPPTPGGGKGADSSVLVARLWGMSCLLSAPLLLSCHRRVMSSGRRRLQLDAGWHLVGAWL